MSTIRWWYESLEWKKKPKMTIQGGGKEKKREKRTNRVWDRGFAPTVFQRI